MALLVEHRHVIYDDTVEQTNVNTAYAYLRTKFFRQGRGHFTSEISLYSRYVHSDGKGDVKCQ